MEKLLFFYAIKSILVELMVEVVTGRSAIEAFCCCRWFRMRDSVCIKGFAMRSNFVVSETRLEEISLLSENTFPIFFGVHFSKSSLSSVSLRDEETLMPISSKVSVLSLIKFFHGSLQRGIHDFV